MDYYMLINKTTGAEVQHFTEEEYAKAKNNIKPERILFVSPDLSSDEFSIFDKIIWTTVFNPINKNYQKVYVKKNTENYDEMKKEAENKIKDISKKNEKMIKEMYEQRDLKKARRKLRDLANGTIELHNKAMEEMDKLIPLDTNEADALYLWAKSGLKRPAGRRIEQIKKTYDMSWRQFSNFVSENIEI